MSTNLSALKATFESLWPLSGAEDWDNPGLVSGSVDQKISRVLLTVDVTNEILEEAIDGSFDLILAHHPTIFKTVTTLAEETAKGNLLSKAIKAGVAIYAAHTNADVVADGVSDTFAKLIGLQNLSALVPEGASVGHGRIGELAEPVALGDLARALAKLLPSTATGVRVAGNYEQLVQTIALCGGAGDSFIGDAIAQGADVYITSDLRHHPAQDARELATLAGKPALIDVSHWASEWLWLEVAARQLEAAVPSVQFVVSQLRTDPWDFVITQ